MLPYIVPFGASVRAQAVSHALASPWSAAAKRSATTLKEVYPRAALVFLHNSINRSTCAPFELRRPLLAFRSARQQRTASHRYQRITLLISQNGMTAGSCQRARSASGSLSLWQSHVEKALGALVERQHEAGARRGCATLAAAQSQSTCSAQHARIAICAQPAHRVLVGKSALVVERARCQCRPSPTFA